MNVQKKIQNQNPKNNECDCVIAYILVYLIAAQLIVFVVVDLFEHVGGGRRVANIDELHIEQKCRTAWNHIASASVAIAKAWWNCQFTFLS